MTPKNVEAWDVKDSESMVREFEHFFYAPYPNSYSIEGAHAFFTEKDANEEGNL